MGGRGYSEGYVAKILFSGRGFKQIAKKWRGYEAKIIYVSKFYK